MMGLAPGGGQDAPQRTPSIPWQPLHRDAAGVRKYSAFQGVPIPRVEKVAMGENPRAWDTRWGAAAASERRRCGQHYRKQCGAMCWPMSAVTPALLRGQVRQAVCDVRGAVARSTTVTARLPMHRCGRHCTGAPAGDRREWRPAPREGEAAGEVALSGRHALDGDAELPGGRQAHDVCQGIGCPGSRTHSARASDHDTIRSVTDGPGAVTVEAVERTIAALERDGGLHAATAVGHGKHRTTDAAIARDRRASR